MMRPGSPGPSRQVVNCAASPGRRSISRSTRNPPSDEIVPPSNRAMISLSRTGQGNGFRLTRPIPPDRWRRPPEILRRLSAAQDDALQF
jgi:hypothetical protein